MARIKGKAISLIFLTVLIVGDVFAEITSPDGYRIEPLVIDGGGGEVVSADYSMVCSVGQSAAGAVAATNTRSDVGFLSCAHYASYEFEFSEMGWQFSGAVPPFDPPLSGWTAGRLNLTPLSTNTFGYWAGDFDIPLLPNKIFLLTAKVSTSVSEPARVPVVRFRYIIEGYAQSGDAVIVSTTPQDEPSETGTNYKFFFQPAQEYFSGGTSREAQLVFDVYNFDVNDATGERISLEHINVDVIDDSALGIPTNSVTYEFTSDAENWLALSPVPFNDPGPSFSYLPGTLVLECADPDHYEYGYVYRDNAISVSPEKLYRVTASCRTDQTYPGATPQIMVRALMGDYHHSVTTTIYTSLNPDIGLTTTNKDYNAFIVSPSYYTGSLTATFDLLNFDPSIAVGSKIYLDEYRIEEFDIPQP